VEQAVSDESARFAIAAIDVDGTLFSERAAQHVFLGILRSSGLLGRAAFARLVAIYMGHRVGLIDPVSARVRGLAVLDGLPLVRAEALADQVVTDLLKVVRPEARAEIAALRAGGACVLLVSASLSLIVSRLAAGLGADGYLASELLVHGERCRGAFAGPVCEGPQKWLALSRFADERFGAGEWTLAAAYGDSPDDVVLLGHAEQAVVVNARTARRRGWRRVDWL
jgi:HAD superfamily hydrolase (TIGR01490 family)